MLTRNFSCLSPDGTLSSVITFQLNRPQGDTCYNYKPLDVLKRSKEVHGTITKNILVRKTQQNDIKNSTKFYEDKL